MPGLPAGTVTFLFTDIEGSTTILGRQPVTYRTAVQRHHDLLQGAVEAHGGTVFETVGDAVYAAFPRPTDAAGAALQGQLTLREEPWGETGTLRVRMGLHLGEVELRGEHYFGLPLYRCARLMATAHGGQIVLSGAVAALIEDTLPEGVQLQDLGAHRLKDLSKPERIFQLTHPRLPDTFPPLRTLEGHPHNLPVQLTTLVGREAEMGAVRQRLLRPDVRLLTLIGTGGVGKTRLALHAAADVLEAFPDGVFFVPPVVAGASSETPATVGAIARTLGVIDEQEPPLECLRRYLSQRHILLVLDELEQDRAPLDFLSSLLTCCPRLEVLATSRSPLRLSGEHTFAVPPLELPLPGPLPPDGEVTRYDAVRLFVERAQAVRPGLSLTAETAPSVVEICRRLDGLPLAIELAAARCSFLSPAALNAQLAARRIQPRLGGPRRGPGADSTRESRLGVGIDLLTGGPLDRPRRQQTLRHTIAWSYDLLSPAEQGLFRRLAVFAGAFSLPAVEAVCLPGASPLEALEGTASLVDKSLVQEAPEAPPLAPDEAPQPRFRMLNTVREFALHALGAGQEVAACEQRHATYWLEVAERARTELHGPAQAAWLRRLELDQDNLAQALGWTVTHGEATLGLRLAAGLFRFWWVRGDFAEGRRWLEGLLALREPPASPAGLRAGALTAAGTLALVQGDVQEARRLQEEGLALWRAGPDLLGTAGALNSLGATLLQEGAPARAEVLCEKGLALRRAADDRAGTGWSLLTLGAIALGNADAARARGHLREAIALLRGAGDRWGTANALGLMGALAEHERDYHLARPLLRESLAIHREVGDPAGIAHVLSTLGDVALGEGQADAARALYAASLRQRRDQENPAEVAISLEDFAGLAAAGRDSQRALRLLDAATALRASLGAPRPLAEERRITRALAALGGAPQPRPAEARLPAGAGPLSLPEAIGYALQDAPPPSGVPDLEDAGDEEDGSAGVQGAQGPPEAQAGATSLAFFSMASRRAS